MLHENGARVAILDRDPERARRLASSGVAIEGPDGRPERRLAIEVSADPSLLGDAELVLVCVKAQADAAAAAVLAKAPAGASVLQLGNGLGRAEALAGLGEERVLFGVTAEGATLLSEGRVRHAGRGPTRIAPLVPREVERARDVAAFLAAHGLAAAFEPDARKLAWEKVLVNAAINAIAGLLDRENGALLESPSARSLAGRAAGETARVARALGIAGDWSEDGARARWEEVARRTGRNLCSTVQDLRNRRMSEVHVINGAIARAAREAGVDAPVNELLAALVAAREELFRIPSQAP